MSKPPLIARQTLTGAVTEALRNQILTGELPDGMQLRQEALSQEFGVSRVPVREALRQLEAEGLVQILDHKGATVTQFSFTDVKELLDIRALVECDLLQRAIPLQSEAELKEAESLLKQFEAALKKKDVSLWGRLNAQFHLSLYRSAGRPHSLALVESLLNKTERYTRMQILYADYSQRAQSEHSALLEFCRKKDAEGGARFLREHILGAEHALENYFAKQGQSR
ncbi:MULTISPECIES: GntR family transcriptional regulator [Leeia]|uniref:GntR family transcriptional regulator n=1 Tax=Leeia aquatica TaxID=2725557 RepID=A0A847S9K6_9NEIS|nr:GntR family transcriptional regulator [Leeia aquatica]NLR75535.1 GntR family transcriptional regulator [Leeia aquatica]